MIAFSRIISLGALAIAFLSGARIEGAVLAYDGFNYSAAALSVAGQTDGGLSFGWSDTWKENTAQTNADLQGPVYVNLTGLNYSKNGSELVVSGGMVEQLDSDLYLPYRAFATPIGGTGALATPQTIWVSFLLKNYGKSIPPVFPPTDVADGYLLFATSAGLDANAVSTTSSRYIGGGRSNGNTYAGNSGTTVANFQAGSPLANLGPDGNVHMIVARFAFGAGSTTANAKVDVWFDPTPGVDPSLDPLSYTSTLTSNTGANLLMAGVFFRGQNTSGQSAFDEIRLGESALDVLPAVVPEPSTVLFAGIGLLGLGLAYLCRRVR